MTRPPILPLLAALLGLGILSSSSKAEAKTNGGGGTSGGGSGGAKLPPPPHDLEVAGRMQVQSGHVPMGIVNYYGGSLNDLRAANPWLQTATPEAIHASGWGWRDGGKIVLPGKWRPFSKPVPSTIPTFHPQPTDPPIFPEPIT